MAHYLTLSLIHGSIGDRNYCKGYSDLDTLLVLNRDTVADSASLRKFARVCYSSLVDLYRFDPLQHHGHMVLTAIDLDNYPETWLPQAAFADARVIIMPAGTVMLRIRDSRPEGRSAFEEDVDYFRLLDARQWAPRDAYEFKYFLSILMLLPTRYLQAKGIFCTKRQSFDLARSSLPTSAWEAMDYATQLRASWPFGRSGLVDSLHSVPGVLNVQKTQFLQHAAVRNECRALLYRFSARCREQAAELAQRMFDNLFAVDTPSIRVPKGKSMDSACAASLSIVNHPDYRPPQEYQQARESFVSQVQGALGVKAIYEFGTVGSPGLSDLDLIVAISDSSNAAGAVEPCQFSIDRLPLSARSLIMHDALIVPETQMEYAYEFLPQADLRELWPCDSCVLARTALNPQTMLYANAAKLVEKLFSYQIWFADTCDVEVLDARWAIASLRSLMYSVSLIETVTGQAPDNGKAFQEAADAIREGWFGDLGLHRKNVEMRDLYSLGRSLARELVAALDAFLTASGWLRGGAPLKNADRIFALQGVGGSVTFGRMDGQFARRDSRWNRGGAWPVHLPWSFMRVISLYAQSGPDLARTLTFDVLRDKAGPPVRPRTEFENYLCQRARHLQVQTRFLLENKFWFGSYLPGYLIHLPPASC